MKFKEEMERLRCTRAQLDYAVVVPQVVVNANGHLAYHLSIFAEPIELIDINSLDPMEWHIKCPYCNEIATIGETLMINGYVGCSNCYFGPVGLLETATHLREHDINAYTSGEFYKKGFKH